MGVEQLYNSVEFDEPVELPVEFQTVGGEVVGKATPDQGGPREPRWSLGSREDADKMQ